MFFSFEVNKPSRTPLVAGIAVRGLLKMTVLPSEWGLTAV
jgi:hypothetical protein